MANAKKKQKTDSSDAPKKKPAAKKAAAPKKAAKAEAADGSDDDAPKSPRKKVSTYDESKTIEDIYQKKTQLEHILLRPDSYIGSVEERDQEMWVFQDVRVCRDAICVFSQELSLRRRARCSGAASSTARACTRFSTRFW